MKIYKFVFILMPIIIIMAFKYVPPAEILGESSRIIYFHVPIAWVSVLAFSISGCYSFITLFFERNITYREYLAYNSSVIGIIFTLLTIITGSIWAKISWGSYWNWDPRESSIVVLMLIYLAYISLYSVLKNHINRSKITSVYLLLAVITMPFFIFIIPRVYPSLHPDTIINTQKKIQLEPNMKVTLLLSIVAFTFLYFYIYGLMNRICSVELKLEDKINNE